MLFSDCSSISSVFRFSLTIIGISVADSAALAVSLHSTLSELTEIAVGVFVLFYLFAIEAANALGLIFPDFTTFY